MKVRIKTHDSKPLFYETEGACAFDFRAKEDVIIAPWKVGLVDTWTAIEIPRWYAMVVLPRSSTFKNFGLIQVNWVGIIDNDYCWNNDTTLFQYLNMTDKEAKIEAWTRIGQGMFVKIWLAEFELVDDLENKDRWWFWTTWNK